MISSVNVDLAWRLWPSPSWTVLVLNWHRNMLLADPAHTAQGRAGGVRQSSQSIALSLQCSLMALPCLIILVCGYHGQPTGNPIPLLKLVECNWISVASFTKQSTQPVILASTVVSLKSIWGSSSMLCFAITSLFGWYHCRSCTCSLHPVWLKWLVCFAPFTQDTVYAWDPKAKVIFHWYHINPWQWSLWNTGY